MNCSDFKDTIKIRLIQRDEILIRLSQMQFEIVLFKFNNDVAESWSASCQEK